MSNRPNTHYEDADISADMKLEALKTPSPVHRACLLQDLEPLLVESEAITANSREAQAAAMNAKLGNNVGGNMLPTFPQYLALHAGKSNSVWATEVRCARKIEPEVYGLIIKAISSEKDGKRKLQLRIKLDCVSFFKLLADQDTLEGRIALIEGCQNPTQPSPLVLRDSLQPDFEENGIRLYHGNSALLLPKLVGVADFILSDPPYGIDHSDINGNKIEGDRKPPLWCVPLLFDAMKLDTSMVLFSHGRVLGDWWGCLEDTGLRNVQDGVWDKVHASSTSNAWERMQTQHESFLMAHKGTSFFVSTEKTPKSILTHAVERGKARVHQHQKPVSLMVELIERHSKPGGLILDPFMGSGPIAAACLITGRQYIGIELEEKYFNAAKARIEDARMPMAVAA